MEVYRLIYRGPIKTIINKSGLKPFLERNYWKISHLLKDSVQVKTNTISYSVVTEGWEEKAQFSTQGGEKTVIEAFLSEIKRNDVVWDVGANIGLYSIPADSIAGKVVAFEPVPYNAARLRNHAPEIEVKEVAISNNAGEISVEQAESISLGWSTEKDSKGHITRKKVVPTEVNAPKPSVVKMDIEGGEWDVLRGMEDWLSNGDIRLIYVEVHPRHITPEADINTYLENFGYTCEQIHQRDDNYFVVGRRDA